MSVLEAHRAAIVATLSAVPEIGVVHDRERYASSNADFARLYTFKPAAGQQHIRGWWVRRSATQERGHLLGPRYEQTHTWTVRGFLSFNDAQASEIVLDSLVEHFRAAVRADLTLGGICQPPPSPEQGGDGVQVVEVGPVHFAGALCHSVLLQLNTWSLQ
ncbi:hypothetical protein [Comamonas denitrificans]|uniref:hypothetical protein n=1 Tax=Comamonas denitrificans TaxID=117506 RepID=UPI003618A9E8